MRITEHPVLTFNRGKEIKFTFDGQEYTGFEGETIAAALHAAGVKVLRHENRPRGFFCAIGNCSSCMMEVNGISNVRVCVEPLQENMVIKRQYDKGHVMGGEQ